MKVTLELQKNLSGDPKRATQGFGRVSREPAPAFDPDRDVESACAFFETNGYVVLAGCLGQQELEHLNGFCDRTQAERPLAWGLTDKRKPHHRGQGLIYSQPLLDYPELDRYTRHPRSYPIVCRLLAARSSPGSRSSTFARLPRTPAPGR